MMTGRVIKIENGLVYLDADDGRRCWFQPIGAYEIGLGDVMTGDLWALGAEEFHNETKVYSMSVFIEGHT